MHRSRSIFDELRERPSDPAALTAEYLDDLLSHRRHELIARYALLLETPRDSALHQLLEGSLFSSEKARPVFETAGVDDPDVSAANFLSLLEGLTFDYCLGSRSRDPHSSETVRQLRIPDRHLPSRSGGHLKSLGQQRLPVQGCRPENNAATKGVLSGTEAGTVPR